MSQEYNSEKPLFMEASESMFFLEIPPERRLNGKEIILDKSGHDIDSCQTKLCQASPKGDNVILVKDIDGYAVWCKSVTSLSPDRKPNKKPYKDGVTRRSGRASSSNWLTKK